MRAVCLIVQNVYDGDPRVRRKAEALAAAGHDVDVLALRAPGGAPSYALNGVNVRTMRLAKRRGSIARYLFEYVVFFGWVAVRAPRQMRTRRYGVIDVNTLPDFLIFAPAIAKWMGASLVLDLHEITPEFFMSKYGLADGSPIVRLLKFLERVSVSFADRVITTSQPAHERFVSRGLRPEKATILLNSADEARGGPRPDAPVRAPGDASFVLVYHGTLTRGYGLDVAIEAFSQVVGEMPGAEFWILGAGPELARLQQLARDRGLADRVRFLGQVPLEAIPQYLSHCHLGVLAIRSDVFFDFAFPNKLPEFVVAGVPALVSRLPVLQHYFSDDAVAYARPNEPEDFARQMRSLFGDRERRARLVARARAEYAPMRWDVMKRRYLDLIGQLEPDVDGAARTLLQYCEARDWAGADPYDALNSDRLRSWRWMHSRWPRLAVTQLLKRSPIDVRAGLRVRPNQNATTFALFLSGLIQAPHLAPENTETLIDSFVSGIATLRSPGEPHWCWGYNFPWQTRTVLVPRHAPNLVATVAVANALQDAHERRRDPRTLAMATSAATYLIDALHWRDGDAAGFAYPAPGRRSQIHNANLLGAAFLIRMHGATGHEAFRTIGLDVARSAVRRQRRDGSWPYGEHASQQWVDSVHAGYNLCALHGIARALQLREFDDAIARGLQFYRRAFVREDGAVPYFHDRPYPIDIQGIAQAILTLVELRSLDEDNLSSARAASEWAIRHMRDAHGFFYYRRLRLGTIRTSYMRWSQAWMFRALAAVAAA